jgi:hypothetical protein
MSTYEERYAAAQARSRRKAAARRSRNTRPHTLDEVRKAVNDAHVQLNRLARREKRDDLCVAAAILREVRRLVSVAPTSRVDLVEFIRQLERTVFDGRLRFGASSPADPEEWRQPVLIAHVTHDGLHQLRMAVADRVRAGTLPAHVPAPVEAPSREPLPSPPPGWIRKLVDEVSSEDGSCED